MIEFKGEISSKCKKFVLRKTTFPEKSGCSITSVIFAVPIIIVAINWDPIVLILLTGVAFFGICPWLPRSKKQISKFIPQRGVIDTEDECVIVYGESFERFHMFSSIEAVRDYGEWYHFEFAYGDKEPAAVCQKNIVSIEDLNAFEELFGFAIKNTQS